MLEQHYTAWIVLVILTALSIVSIAFEKGLLGFIGIVLFVVVKAGLLNVIADNIFDTADDRDLLTELTEDVHMMLFAVMVLFLLFALGLTFIGRRISNRWILFERRSRNPALVYVKLQEAINKHRYDDWYTSGHRQLKNIRELAEYASIRERFVRTPRKSASLLVDWEGELSPSFDFAEYLILCLSDLLAHLVEVPVMGWVLLQVMFIFVSVGIVVDPKFRPLLVFALGIIPLPITIIALWKMKWVLKQLTAPMLSRDRQTHSDSVFVDESTALLPIIPVNSESAPYLSTPNKTSASRAKGNRHEQLFWFGKNGKAVVILMLRFMLHIQSTYVSLLFVLGVTDTLNLDSLIPDAFSGRVLLVILLTFPPIVFVLLLPSMLQTFVMATSIELMKNAENIRRVVREMKTRKALKALKLLITLQLDKDAAQAVSIFRPVDTSHIILPDYLSNLCEGIIRVSHLQWYNEQISANWRFGPTFNEAEKTHPSLLPFDQLDAAAQARSREVGTKFLRVIYALGFTITAAQPSSMHIPLMDQDIARLLEQAKLDDTPLKTEVSKLVSLLAADRHHTWAWNRMKLGWSHTDEHLQDSRLVPFDDLDDQQKMEYTSSIEILLRFLMLAGWTIRQQHQPHLTLASGDSSPGPGDIQSRAHHRFSLSTRSGYGADRNDGDDSSFCGIIPDEDEDDIRKTFAMFDPTSSGVVPKSSILFALEALGWAVDVTEAANIAIQMNPNPKSNTVTYHQFYNWIRRRETLRDNPPDLDHIIEQSFIQLDADSSGFITARELQDSMQRFGETLDSEDAEAIIREADRDGDGRINRKEFADLMKGLLAHA